MIKGAGEHANSSAKCGAHDGVDRVVHAHINLRKGDDEGPAQSKWQDWFPATIKHKDEKHRYGEMVCSVCGGKAVPSTAMYPVDDVTGELKIVAGAYSSDKWLDEPGSDQIAHSKC